MSSKKPKTTVLPSAVKGSDSPLRKIETPVASKTSRAIAPTRASSGRSPPPPKTLTVACKFASIAGARSNRSRKLLSATAFA
jgi:hypothetical protein